MAKTPLRASSVYLTVDELAVILRVNPMTLYRMIRRKELPAFRVGKQYRIRRDAMEEMFHVGHKGGRR